MAGVAGALAGAVEGTALQALLVGKESRAPVRVAAFHAYGPGPELGAWAQL